VSSILTGSTSNTVSASADPPVDVAARASRILSGEARMARRMKIDFVSDIVCPWCAIGLFALEQALERLRDVVEAEIQIQPFELNPDLPRAGEALVEHFARKLGLSGAEAAAARERVRERAASVGFTIAMSDDSRIYNTFNAHRLLRWAQVEGRQIALEHRLLGAYFTDGSDVSDPEVLVRLAEAVELNPMSARRVLDSDLYADEVRAAEQLWHARGIQSVPATIIDGQYLISGGQPSELFEQALRRIAEAAD
jgi:predicted DsbA family dithiol-disulfide isomerase